MVGKSLLVVFTTVVWLFGGVTSLQAAISASGTTVTQKPALDSVDELVRQGMAYNAAGRIEEALGVFRQAAELAPDNAFVLFNLGTTLGMAKRYQEAATFLKDAVRFSPDLQPAWANLGAMHNLLGKHNEALAAFRQVLRLNPQDANAHFQSGINLLMLGNLPAASIEEEELRAIDPDLADALLKQIMSSGKTE